MPLRLVVFGLGVPAMLFLLLYARLLIGPLNLPVLRGQIEAAVSRSLAEGMRLEIGEIGLALDGLFHPVLQLSPVKFVDTNIGATVPMQSLDIGFAPFQALIGRPGVTIALIAPQLQMVQDLLGPRLATFELLKDDQAGSDQVTSGQTMSGQAGRDIVRVIEGNQAFPNVGILAQGIDVRGSVPEGAGLGLRSDNDWLIYNAESGEKSLRDLAEQVAAGTFSQLDIRDGRLQMHDAVYGLYREFVDVNARILPGAPGEETVGAFSAKLAGQVIQGSFKRSVLDDGNSKLHAKIANLDLAAIVPFLDDPDGLLALRGTGAMIVDMTFSEGTGEVLLGEFDIDLGGTQLRMQDDSYPVLQARMRIVWHPSAAEFRLAPTLLKIADSSAQMSGVFVLGLDDVYGPIVSMSLNTTDLSIQPGDMAPPEVPFSDVQFVGWSAPLYGAIGIDRLTITKPGMELRATGRMDMLLDGAGVYFEVGGEGASADDLKRIWPYFLSESNRDWFVQHVAGGKIISSAMRFDFPVSPPGPDGSPFSAGSGDMSVEIVAEGIVFSPTDEIAPIPVNGQTTLVLSNGGLNVQMEQLAIENDGGMIDIGTANLQMDFTSDVETIIRMSGDAAGQIPAFIGMVRQQAPDALDTDSLPLDPDALAGSIKTDIAAVIRLDELGEMADVSYEATGSITGFKSSEKIADRTVDNGAFTFSFTPAGYSVNGTAQMDGLPADLSLAGTLDGAPEISVSSTIEVGELAKLGFDVSEFGSGQVHFQASPIEGGALRMEIDLVDASLTLDDLGLSKAQGVPGKVTAVIVQEGSRTKVSDINLAFLDVKIAGSVDYDADNGLISAQFPQFGLSSGDNASVEVTPISGGFAVGIRGEQLDLRPMLKRFFALDQASTGGVKAQSIEQSIELDLNLERAIGFYRVTAYNLDAELSLHGDDLRRVSLQTQFAQGNTVSITTNVVDPGRTMSVAFNDAGTLLRFLNVYPRLLGGAGSVVLTRNTAENADYGEIRLNAFSLVDEENVAQILGSHRDSQSLIARENRLTFRSAKANFVRRSDRVEVEEGVLVGDSIGGTMRGFIYTKTRQYDLAGTYVPLFGLNNIFQQLPVIGQLIGGREGEGLVGVTFAIRGDLDKPTFLVNPVSILVPGVFRSLFEFRAEEAPREAN